MASTKLKNKKIRFVYYAIFGCSLLAIGFTSYYFYRVYKENIALKETMENIIKTKKFMMCGIKKMKIGRRQ